MKIGVFSPGFWRKFAFWEERVSCLDRKDGHCQSVRTVSSDTFLVHSKKPKAPLPQGWTMPEYRQYENTP